jgi:hypothetical protein
MANLFGSEVPAQGDNNDSVSYTLGTYFSSDQDDTVVMGRWYFPNPAPTGTVSHGIFRNSDQQLLGTTTFASPTAGAWNTCMYSSAIPISAGVTYTAVIFTSGQYVATNSYSFPKVSGHLTAPTGAGHFGQASSPFTFPANTVGSNYFVDLETAGGGSPTATGNVKLGLKATGASAKRVVRAAGAKLGLKATGPASGGNASAGPSGSAGWFQLSSIFREQQEDTAQLYALGPQACPICGTPLDQNARTGQQGCPNDGWIWTGSNWRP